MGGEVGTIVGTIVGFEVGTDVLGGKVVIGGSVTGRGVVGEIVFIGESVCGGCGGSVGDVVGGCGRDNIDREGLDCFILLRILFSDTSVVMLGLDIMVGGCAVAEEEEEEEDAIEEFILLLDLLPFPEPIIDPI